MDAGEVAEFKSPETLFMKEDSIFRILCDRSRIGLEDIRVARQGFRDLRSDDAGTRLSQSIHQLL